MAGGKPGRVVLALGPGRTDPPFAGDNGFGDAIADYRQRQFSIYQGFAAQGPDAAGAKAWFKDKKAVLETANGLTPTGLALAPLLVETMTHAPEWLEAIGALNRWPERSSLPLPSYLEAWIRSCGEIKANPALPERLQGLLL